MIKQISTILIIIATFSGYSQKTCDCNTALNNLIEKVEKEYPGFVEKTKDSLMYISFKKHLVEIAGKNQDDICLNILKKYTNYFNDGHLVVVSNGKQETNTGINQQIKKIDINIDEFKKYLKSSIDSLEGIWNSGSYEIGLIKQNKGYKAFVISSKNNSWKPSEIKFELKEKGNATYFMGDHSPESDTFSIFNQSILYFHNTEVAFTKIEPKPTLTEKQLADKLNELEGFYIKPLSEKTNILKMSSFDYSNVERVEKLISDNEDVLKKTENLIIDVRGNGGGTDYCYRPIMPYLYTNPVRHLGAEYMVTQTLIDGLANWVKKADKSKYAEEIEETKSDLKRMEGKIGQFIPYSTESSFGFSEQDSIYQYPKKVAIIIDNGCGSSTEKFLLKTKQSKKVKVFGVPTYGAVDYISVREFDFGCDNYTLYMSTIRMMRLPEYPLDNIGIQPDIFMDRFVKDWVKYAQEYLENE